MDFLREMLSQNGLNSEVIESILKDTEYYEAGVKRSVINNLSLPVGTNYAPGAFFSTDDYGKLLNIAQPLFDDNKSGVTRNFMFL